MLKRSQKHVRKYKTKNSLFSVSKEAVQHEIIKYLRYKRKHPCRCIHGCLLRCSRANLHHTRVSFSVHGTDSENLDRKTRALENAIRIQEDRTNHLHED